MMKFKNAFKKTYLFMESFLVDRNTSNTSLTPSSDVCETFVRKHCDTWIIPENGSKIGSFQQ